MQRTPAGLPAGIPGIGEEIDGAMQHAPHPARHDFDAEARFNERDSLMPLLSPCKANHVNSSE
jgi:hypothetical protein